jgi:diguanylate cyclase (GGDEF)-like protein
VDSIIRKLGETAPGSLYLVTGDGSLVSASSGGSSELMKQRLTTTTLGRLRNNAGSVVQYSNQAATEVVGTASPVVTPGWSVVTEIPTAEAYRQVIRLRNVTVLIVAGLLAGVGLIAYLLGLVIVRPLNRLTSGAAKVATGDLAVDLPVMGGGEVGYLTEVFNNMVARLREGREQLDAIHETLRTKNEELERLSVTDVLTGISNRRYLMQRLADEQGRARRLGRGFSILMMDVDFFKKYNDTFGHQAGDEVLARVGAVLRQTIRAVDCAARYGGEEFLVVLPDTGMDGAVEVAERLRAKMAGQEFEGGTVTLSVGVAAFPEHGETSETVVGAADAALYRAKREGRDRVVRSGRRRTREVRHPKGDD